MTSNANRLWVRCGLNDDYNDFGSDLSAVADYLIELKLTSPFVRCNEFGVSSIEMTHDNYISLYWGDAAAQAVRGLTIDELQELNDKVAQGRKMT